MKEVGISSSLDLIKKLSSLSKASSISLTRCGMLTIPRLILYLPNLQTLDLSSNPIKSLDALWEANLPNLHELNLAACWLKSLPYGPPSFHTSLVYLNLDGNFLGRFVPQFTVFKHLKRLSLVGNDFLSVPQLPPQLEKLSFRLNSFSTIPQSSVSIFDASYCSLPFSKISILSRQITNLDLSHCGIRGKLEIPAMSLLDTFDGSNNAITSIDFESSRRMTILRLSFNGLSTFPEVLLKFPMLRIVELSHNAISSIPNDLSCLKRVESIDLSHNQLITGRLKLPPRLQGIRLSFNFAVAFESFPFSLKHLDVSFCKAATIPPIPPALEWLAAYFVSRLIVSDRIRAITDESSKNGSEEAVSFIQERPILGDTRSIGTKTLMNDKLSDYIGCSATSGRSTKYEDNFMSTEWKGISFVGVFDGHAGHEAAFISAETFSNLLGKIIGPVFNDQPYIVKSAIRRTFALVNDELRRRAVKDGTTAVIVGIKEQRVIVGHLGDSLALMVCKESEEWLTRPHRPNDKNEYNRMRAEQKAVTDDWRVDGKLCVSRSLGDFWCCDGMYDEPDVVIRQVPEGILSIVLGCDGLWDYVDSGAVCNVVRSIRDPVKASKLLQDYAFASGSHDSISVIVMNFPETKKNEQ